MKQIIANANAQGDVMKRLSRDYASFTTITSRRMDGLTQTLQDVQMQHVRGMAEIWRDTVSYQQTLYDMSAEATIVRQATTAILQEYTLLVTGVQSLQGGRLSPLLLDPDTLILTLRHVQTELTAEDSQVFLAHRDTS